MLVEYECDAGVATIHLNRPERLNSVVPALTQALVAALQRAEADQVRATVIAGRGRAFCAGHDLKEPDRVESVLQTRARLEEIQDVTRMIRRLPGPVIAAVHGYALGAGCEFALACDLVVAAEDAQFGFPEVSVGLSVTGGVSRLLPVLVGWARAKELLLLGERVSGVDAAAMGLVARTAPSGEHESVALALAGRIAERPPVAVSLAKRVLDHGLDASIEEAMARETEHAILTAGSGEAAEPKEAFGRG